MPTPRRMAPVSWAYFSRSSLHLMKSAPLTDAVPESGGVARDAVGGVHIAQRHTVFQPESSGSHPISRAMSSIMHSTAKLHCGMP